MRNAVHEFYYKQITDKDSKENGVDNFWLNLLIDYFNKKLTYGIEQEARMLPEVFEQRTDWAIRCIRNGDLKKVIITMNKRKGLESQASQWADALRQHTTYLKFVRAESGQADQTLYGVVNIETYTRFYQLDPNEHECIDYPGTDGNGYELAENEADIHAILLDLIQKTSHS